MDKFQLKSQFNVTITKTGFQLDYVWANVSQNECKYAITKAYRLDFHKLMYIELKLLNTFPMYNKKPLMFPFI